MQENFMQPDYHVQIVLEFEQLFIKKDRRNIWLQYLLDTPLKVRDLKFFAKTLKFKEQRYLMFNVYQLGEDADTPETKLTKRELRNATKIDPSLPAMKGYVIDYYRHNGYLFALEPGRKYVIVATTSKPVESDEECKFMIRTIGPRITMKHLEDWTFQSYLYKMITGIKNIEYCQRFVLEFYCIFLMFKFVFPN